jgi:hypothetical protein
VQRRTFIKASAATALIAREWRALARDQPNGQPANDCCTAFVWQTWFPRPLTFRHLTVIPTRFPILSGASAPGSIWQFLLKEITFPRCWVGASSIVEVRAYLVLVMWKTESWSKFSGTTSHPEAEAERRNRL